MKFKALITSLLCTLLGAWYLASSVGFDIHRDHHCGCVYVVSLLHGTSCDEIHPADACTHCHHHACTDSEEACHECDGHEEDGEACPECTGHEEGGCEDCSDELEQLTVTGTEDTGTIVLTVPVHTVPSLHFGITPVQATPRHGFNLRNTPAPPSRSCPSTDVLRV